MTDQPTIYRGTVIATSGLCVRSVPTTEGNVPLFALQYGTKVESDRIENGWWHLTKINNIPTTGEGWSFEGTGGSYIRTDLTPPVGRTFAYVYKNFERPGIWVSRPTQNGSAL